MLTFQYPRSRRPSQKQRYSSSSDRPCWRVTGAPGNIPRSRITASSRGIPFRTRQSGGNSPSRAPCPLMPSAESHRGANFCMCFCRWNAAKRTDSLSAWAQRPIESRVRCERLQPGHGIDPRQPLVAVSATRCAKLCEEVEGDAPTRRDPLGRCARPRAGAEGPGRGSHSKGKPIRPRPRLLRSLFDRPGHLPRNRCDQTPAFRTVVEACPEPGGGARCADPLGNGHGSAECAPAKTCETADTSAQRKSALRPFR